MKIRVALASGELDAQGKQSVRVFEAEAEPRPDAGGLVSENGKPRYAWPEGTSLMEPTRVQSASFAEFS